MPRLCGGRDSKATATGSSHAGRIRATASGSEAEATKELTSAVIEFLQFHGYGLTLETFAAERQAKSDRKPCTPLTKGADRSKSPRRLLERFDAGRREEFFAIWERYIPAELLASDSDTAKLEFYLQIYFAVFPVLASNSQQTASSTKSREELTMRMRGFKSFLETRGAELVRTGEFLPYYALPYVDNPTKHPSFKELFNGSWSKDLRQQLDYFLQIIPTDIAHPKLYSMLAAFRREPSDSYHRPLSALLRGEDELPDVAGASGSTPTASAMPSRQSGGPSSIEPHGSSETQLKPNARSHSLPEAEPVALESLPRVLKQSVHLDGSNSNIPQKRSAFQQAILPPLNYARIRADLETGSNDAVTHILQALRWRITKSPAGYDRLRVVLTFVERDVLNCAGSGPSLIQSIADRCNGPAAEELTRLINCMASRASGRAYLLLPNGRTVENLVQLLTAIPAMDTLNEPMILAHEGVGNMASDSLLQQHALGALQKLSLLRRAQSQMIAMDCVGIVCSLLDSELEGLSEYTVEYSMALLMNLSLRSEGKKRFESCDILSILDSLIESSNPQVRTYVNGTLYSVLQKQPIRNAAQERGLGDFLQVVADNSEDVFARQIRYIQVQLSSTAPDYSGPPSDDEEEFEDIDEDGEDEGDEADDFEAEARPVVGQLIGEELLCEGYLADVSAANEEDEMMNDTMSVATATINMAKHFQGGRLDGTIRSGAVAASLNGEVLQRPSTPASFNNSLRSNSLRAVTAVAPPQRQHSANRRNSCTSPEHGLSHRSSRGRSGDGSQPASGETSRSQIPRDPTALSRGSSGGASRHERPPSASNSRGHHRSGSSSSNREIRTPRTGRAEDAAGRRDPDSSRIPGHEHRRPGSTSSRDNGGQGSRPPSERRHSGMSSAGSHKQSGSNPPDTHNRRI
mmetsp:Transcript_25630/g.71669  ORF Transcript_25630/g.71669 Transcript_25630/m.71669 type:complete len:917 (-) Transcript_25630:266-3016(-)